VEHLRAAAANFRRAARARQGKVSNLALTGPRAVPVLQARASSLVPAQTSSPAAVHGPQPAPAVPRAAPVPRGPSPPAPAFRAPAERGPAASPAGPQVKVRQAREASATSPGRAESPSAQSPVALRSPAASRAGQTRVPDSKASPVASSPSQAANQAGPQVRAASASYIPGWPNWFTLGTSLR